MSEEFHGVLGDQVASFYLTENDPIIEAIKKAFKLGFGRKFNICAINQLPNYNNHTFAKWATECHCESLEPEKLAMLKVYVVNYFLCPEAVDRFEVEAWVQMVFPEDFKEDIKKKKKWWQRK